MKQLSFGQKPAKTVREYVREKVRDFAERRKLRRSRKARLPRPDVEQERLPLDR